jgi:hypothetical protein
LAPVIPPELVPFYPAANSQDGVKCRLQSLQGGFTAEHMAKLPADEIILARKGHASDLKRDTPAQFARKAMKTRGKVSDADLKALRDAG